MRSCPLSTTNGGEGGAEAQARGRRGLGQGPQGRSPLAPCPSTRNMESEPRNPKAWAKDLKVFRPLPPNVKHEIRNTKTLAKNLTVSRPSPRNKNHGTRKPEIRDFKALAEDFKVHPCPLSTTEPQRHLDYRHVFCTSPSWDPRFIGLAETEILEGRYKAAWKGTFKLPWHEAGRHDHQDDKVDLDQ